MPHIEIEHLKYIYSQGTPFQITALDDINLSIEKGGFIGIIGHTGSGKSTLVQHLNGLIKPTSGTVKIDGVNIWENPKQIRRVRFQVGLVFQYPEHQLFAETVFKDIAFGPQNMGLEDEEIKRRVYNAAEMVGLASKYMKESPFDLSGGEKRRVAIAGVIAMNPSVLVLDEPTAGLDPKGRDMILELVTHYHKTTGSTVIFVSHSMEDIARVAQKVIVMNGSRIAMYDDVGSIFSQSVKLEEMGLSVPAITKIFAGLRDKGVPVDTSVFTMEQAVNEINRVQKGGTLRA